MDPRAISAALLRSLRPGPPRLEVLGRIPAPPRAVGLLAGSFDPMTVAHAALADALHARADLVLFVYSPRTMAKPAGSEEPLLTPERRLASVAGWCAGRPGFEVAVCSHGLYADQARAARSAFPDAEIVLGLGSDQVVRLLDPSWYEDRDAALADLFALATVAHAERPGGEDGGSRPTEDGWMSRMVRLDVPESIAGVASSQVRARIREGRDVSSLVPPEILPFLPPEG